MINLFKKDKENNGIGKDNKSLYLFVLLLVIYEIVILFFMIKN